METRLIGCDHAETMTELASWANGLISHEVPGAPNYVVIKVVQFQTVARADGYAALVLVEVTERFSDEQITLKEADVVAIEEMTSTVNEEMA